MPGVPLKSGRRKCARVKPKAGISEDLLLYGLLWKLAKEATDGLTLDHTIAGRQVGGVYLYLQIIATLFSIPVSCPFFGRPGYGYGRDSHWRQPACLSVD